MTEREIFVAALNQPGAAERRAFLDQACGGNAEARARVEALLAEHDRLGSFLERPAANPPEVVALAQTIDSAGTAAPTEVAVAGDRIGPYKLLEVIGEGGMGSVWMAQQQEPIRRRVAVKLVKAGMDSKQVLARFEAERQALALMDHPNIARVFDAGATASGRPYFVMELVRGVPLTKFCDDRHLGVMERLRIFQQVCGAVQHAHQKGVIHRDLKPSNILVESHDGKPVPKVIDFGLAKAVGTTSLTDRSLFTNFGAMVGTPLYMAPEQAEFGALDVDTRADVYALGVLLYELLTGTTPIERGRLAKAGWDEIRRVIKEEEPPSPSARLSSSAARGTVAALRQTEAARLGRFVKGDLDWVVMKALAKERDRRYESASAFGDDIERFLNHEPVSAGPPTTVYRLRKLARRNKAALAATGLVLLVLALIGGGVGWVLRDRSARLAATEQEASLASREAEDLIRQGRYKDGLSAARRGEVILTGVGGEGIRRRLLELQKEARMALRLDGIRTTGGGGEGAADRDTQYVQAFRDFGIDPDSLTTEEVAELVTAQVIRTELIVALDTWASERKAAGKTPESWKRLIAAARSADADEQRNRVRDALEQNKFEGLKGLADSPTIGSLPLQTLDLLGTALHHQHGRVDEDIIFFRAVQRRYPGDFSINFKLGWALEHRDQPRLDEAIRCYSMALALRPEDVGLLCHLSDVLNKAGRVEDAIGYLRRANELDPKQATRHFLLATWLEKVKRFDEAIASFRDAIAVEPKYAKAHNNLGFLLAEQGKRDEAIRCYKTAIALQPNNALYYNNLGKALVEQGKFDEGIASYNKAIALDPRYVQARNNLGFAYSLQGKHQQAINNYQMAILVDPKYALPYYNLAIVLRKQGKLDEAIQLDKRAIELEPNRAVYHANLVSLMVQQGKYAEMIGCCRKLIALEPKNGDAHAYLAMALDRQGRKAEAIASYRNAIPLMPKHPSLLNNLGHLLLDQGQLDEAVGLFEKAIALEPAEVIYHLNLGNARYKQEKLDEAIKSFYKAIALAPDLAIGHSKLGDMLAEQGKAGEAINRYRIVSALLRQQNKLSEAVGFYRKVLRLYPNNAWANGEWSCVLHEQGKVDEAVARHKTAVAGFVEAVGREPRSAKSHDDFAWLLLNHPNPALRDPARALPLAKTAVELAPDDPTFLRTLSVAHHRAGDWKAAIAVLERSMDLHKGGDEIACLLLAMAHQQSGDKERTKTYHERATWWKEKRQPVDREARSFRQEAAKVLGLTEGAVPPRSFLKAR